MRKTRNMGAIAFDPAKKIGKRYNEWVILEHRPDGRRDPYYFLCRCSCGVERVVRWYDIIKEKSKNCGHDKTGVVASCKTRRKYHTAEDITVSNFIHSRKHNASIVRGHEWTLSHEDVKGIIFKKCFYCGANGTLQTRLQGGTISLPHNGIDRYDSYDGYTASNCVPCCLTCNIVKASHTIPELREIITKLYTRLPMWGGTPCRTKK